MITYTNACTHMGTHVHLVLGCIVRILTIFTHAHIYTHMHTKYTSQKHIDTLHTHAHTHNTNTYVNRRPLLDLLESKNRKIMKDNNV